MSAARNSAWPPSATIAATVCSPRSALRPVTTTVAPRRANSFAVSLPIPAVAPVTSTRRSFSSMTTPEFEFHCLQVSSASARGVEDVADAVEVVRERVMAGAHDAELAVEGADGRAQLTFELGE